MSNNNIWDIINLKNDNIKKRKIINSKQKLIKYNTKNKKYISYPKTLPYVSNYKFNQPLKSISYSNELIQTLDPVLWIDASDLSSIQRDHNNNVFKILDKSIYNNHLSQNQPEYQPKYHNGGILFNSHQFLIGSNLNQPITNMSIFIVLKQYNQSLNQGILSGYSVGYENDNTNPNGFSFYGSNNKFNYQFMSNNISINDNLVILYGYETNLIVAYSSDGINWTQNQSLQNIMTQVYDIKWNGLMWLAGGVTTTTKSQYRLAYSLDGISWSANPIANQFYNYDGNIKNIEWSGSIWVITGRYTNVSTSVFIMYSSDGFNWVPIPYIELFGYTQYTSIKFSGKIWLLSSTSTNDQDCFLGYSYDLFNWNPCTNVNFMQAVNTFDYNGLLWVCAGSNSSGNYSLGYSYDGIDWVESNSSLLELCNIIKSNGSIWIAGGQNTSLAYSYDGINWVESPSASLMDNVNTLSWTGSFWIAGGFGTNNLLYSDDGITWTPNQIDFLPVSSSAVFEIASKNIPYFNTSIEYGVYEIVINNNVGSMYNNGRLINTNTFADLEIFNDLVLGARFIYGDFRNFFNGEIYEMIILNLAAEGETRYQIEKYLIDKWNTTQFSRTPPLSNIYTWLDASSKYNFTLDQNNNVLSWNDKNNKLNFIQNISKYYPKFDKNKVIFNNSYLSMTDSEGLDLNNFSLFYIVEELNNTNNANLLKCTDGFELTTTPAENFLIGVGSASAIYSNNGINWSKSESLSSLFTSVNKIAYNGKMWVAGGEGTDYRLAYSYDGINWTASGSGSNLFTEVNALACNDFIWLAGGVGNVGVRLAYSYDGINWVSSVSGTNLFTNISDFAWNGNTWVISCELNTNQVGYSSDGINWNLSKNGINCNQCYGLSTNGVMFIVGSNKSGTYSNVLGYSFDGDVWNTSASANSIFNSIKCIAWNKSMWVAGGNTLGYSYDGITWSALGVNSLFSSYKSIAWNGNLWITCGAAGGQLAYSSNGINWTQVSIDNNIVINSIASKKILQFIIEKTDKFTVGVGANGKIIYSYDGINYKETVPLVITPSSYNWNSAMVALNKTAAGGEVVRYTPDGINWSAQATNLVGYDMNSVKWTGSKWIAVGSGYISSTNGVNWSYITSMYTLLGGNHAQCVCVGNGVIVVISRPNTVIYSTDGGTIWYLSISGSNKLNNSDYPMKNLVFGNNMFVCGGNGMIMYSYDGITWELCNTSGVNWSTVTVRCLTWNGSFFLGCGYIYISPYVPTVSIFIKSTDGINWSRHYTNIDSGLSLGADICWAKNIFVLLAFEGIVYSYDGNTWVIVRNTPSNPITSGAYSVTYNGRFVVYGLRYSQTWITYSDDGITWSGSAYIYNGHTEYQYWTLDIESKNVRPFTYDNTILINWSCIGYNGSMWIAGGSTASSGHIGYSYDGITWNEIESVRTIFTSNVTGITWNGSRWVVVGNTTTGGIIAYSEDGITWQLSNDYSIFTDTCSAVAASDKLFVCGGNVVGYSTDGVNLWEISSSGSAIFTNSCNCLAWNGTIWLAGGYGTSSVKLAYSSDGITWTESTSGSNLFSAIPTSFAWNGTYWIGVSGDSGVPGTVGVVGLSVDGITWIKSISGSALFPTGVSNIIWNDSIWIASDNNNIIGYSHDGITWVENTSINVPIINFASRRALPYYTSANKNTGGGINLKINDINLNYVDSELLLPKKLYEYNIKDGIGTVYINGVEKGSADFGVLNTTNNFRLGFNISNIDTFVIGCCLYKNGLIISKMVYSYDNGVTWFAPESINSLFDSCQYTGYNGSRWLVVAQKNGNTIAYSDDGINWTESQNISSILTGVYGIDFYDSKWYIYGYYDPGSASIGRVIYSTDNGITWSIATPVASLFDGVVQQIIYNGSIWVACGQSTNRLAYSNDNITWFASNSGNTIFTGHCDRIEYNNNMWVAGGEDGKLAYSNNGIDWVQITSPLAGNNIQDIKSNGNIWVAGAGNLGYSSNGTDWYVSQSGNDLNIANIMSICWNGSVWMATYQPGIVIYSTDGISWIIQKSEYYISIIKSNYILPSPAPPPNTDTVVIASGGIRGYTDNTLVYSYNGLTWIPSTSANNIFDACYASGYSGSRWVVIGTYNYYNLLTAYSDDGINWTLSQNVESMIDYATGLGVGFYNSIWYIWGAKQNINYTGSVIYSNDNGLTWNAATTLPSLFTNVGGNAGSVNQIIYNGSIWVACGKVSNRLAYSYDNITWNESLSGNNIFTYECNKIEYNNNMWVAGGNNSKLAYSYNGIDWIQTTSPFTYNNSIKDIKSNGNLWLATDLNFIGYSYNGIDWKSSELIVNTYIICWTGAIWIVGSYSDACIYSTDGINWVKPSRNIPLFTNRIYGITAKYPSSSNINVNMHELIILKDSASFNQRNQIYSYLSGKWNLPINISAPAPNPTIWLDANNSDSITLDGSNNILTWNDLSTNNYTVTINGTKPILANYGNVKAAALNGSTDVNINIPQLTGSSNTIFLVFSASNLNANNNNRLISFSNGTNDYSNNSFNINSNTNTGTLIYDSTNQYVAPSFSSTSVAGIQLWFDGADPLGTGTPPSNGASVTTWVDKSGNGYNTTSVSGTAPTYNSSTTSITFNGSSYYNLPNGSIPFGDSSYSIYAVFSFSSIPSNHAVISGGTNTNFGGIFIRSASSKISYGWYGPNVQENTTDTASSGTRYMTNTHYLSGSNTGYGYLNGNTQPTFSIGNSRIQPNTNNFIANSPFGIMAGTISEILVYNISHTTNQRQLVEGYLAWKWGLQKQLPNSHPYYSINYYYQTINFNDSLYIYTIQNINNNVNIYINNYLVNSFTNSQNYNYTKLDLGSLFGNSNNWFGYIGEFIYYNTSIDINGTVNYLANKWTINLQSPVINEYIPRSTVPINKYIPLTNIFENNTNYVSISDTPDKSQVLNFNINVPVKDTLPNQLTLISYATVFLTPNQKNTLYNLIEFSDFCSIVLPTLTYDNDYFAFTNSGIYDVTITDSIGLDVTITPSQTIYFTNISGSYTDTPTFQGFNCTLNRYDNIISNSFTVYIGGWSNNLLYIPVLCVNYINNDFIMTENIYVNQTYQANFYLDIAPGIYNLIISDTESTGNIINSAISTPVTIYARLYRNKKMNSYNFLLNNTNHTGSYSINLENLLNDNENDYEISDLYVNAFLNDKYLKDEFIQIVHIPTSEIKDNIISFDYSFDISRDYYFIITDSPKLDGSININLMNNINKLELSIDINQTYGFTNTNNVYTLTLSNNESFDLTLYEKIWNIYYNNTFVTQAILNKNQTIIFSYNPTIPINSMFSISTSKNLMLTKINKPITISNISFKIEHNKLNLIGWNSNITIPTLYIFDTNSNKLLTTVDTQNPVINYKFPRAQNYLTISDTNDMTGIINYVIKEPLYIEAQLNIKIKQLNTDNWGYLNTSKSFSFILDTYYDNISVNYSDYYSTISIYYANNPDNNDLTLIDTVLVVNNQVNFTFTPTETNIYFYFNDAHSSEYIFFNRDELVFTLNNDILTSNININSKLYVYSNQTYLTDVINSCINLPKLNIGTYYLSISNIDKNGIKTINDINVNINEPLIIDKVNLEINKNYGFIDKNNNYLISTNGNIYYSTEITNDINKLIKISNVNSFNFDNSELKLSHVYFYNSYLERTNLINFYDKSLITFTLDHYDNKISKFRLIVNKWDSVLNNIVLNIYIENTNYNPIPVTLDINNNIYSGLFNIDFNLLDTGKYNIIVSSPDINYKIPELLVVNKYVVKNSTNITSKIIKTITGKLDDINNHSIKLDSNYDNIELNNSSIIIKHSIVDNIINFSYDSGFESNVTFNIVNSVTKEIYEIINATYL